MKKILLYIAILFSGNAYSQEISEKTIVSLITVGPGKQNDELYTVFGHSAIRIQDTALGFDDVYDFGGFDFRTEGFYIKFMRGQLLYMMNIESFRNNFYSWQMQNRNVTEQILDLTTNQKKSLYSVLITNYLPENRYYKYKFFYDNCSTRIAEIFKTVLKDSVQFSTTLNAGKSYRQWIGSCAEVSKPWSDFGMDLAIGLPSDQKTDAKGALFLPKNLKMGFDSAQIIKNDIKSPLVVSTIELFQSGEEQIIESWFIPNFLSWFAFFLILGITVFQYFSNNNSFLLDKVLFIFAGLIGILIVLLWFGTDHGVTTQNFNLIWASPLLLLFIKNLNSKSQSNFKSKFFLIYGIAQILLLVFWKYLPQEINNALIPIVLILAIRAFYVWKRIS